MLLPFKLSTDVFDVDIDVTLSQCWPRRACTYTSFVFAAEYSVYADVDIAADA